MIEQDLIEKTKLFVREMLAEAETGHDWAHAERVWKTARHIAEQEEADMLTVELGALLHDIADPKFNDGDEEIGPRRAATFLENCDVEEEKIAHVVQMIENISFKGGNTEQSFRSKELDIVQDADRLDAIGAIGIARTFNYGGYKNRPLYDPEIEPRTGLTKEEYRNEPVPTINHFYEKLLLLKDRMNTETGAQMALKRHRFMEEFLARFYREWAGEF